MLQLNASWPQVPIWAGESPQFVGLDQVNITFPACTGPAVTTEQRYDAYIEFSFSVADKNLGIGFAALYLPFVVAVGDPGCQP